MQGIKLDWTAVLTSERSISEKSPVNIGEDGCIVNFAKVLELEKKGELLSFFLHTPDNKWSIGVHLISGQFLFGDYIIHPAPDIAELKPDYRIINVRRRGRDMTVEHGWISDPFIIKYILGWQCTINGENYQRLMFVDPETLEVNLRSKR